ncbi:MAG: 2OG-Fe(II) oxygenase [Legionella sp.]|nr:MAG: 2OG-Fe(II) oxygenase [Legionella sp.]
MDIINTEYLSLEDRSEFFFNARPFPHLVLDNFLEKNFFLNLKNIFEQITDSTAGKRFNSAVEEKKWISLNSNLPDAVTKIVDSLNSETWVKSMRGLTGINSLIATPNGNTRLANYHVMDPGGILGPHVDHSHEPLKGIPHVLNTILYLSDSWENQAGGATLFYDAKGEKAVSRIEYKPNRAVIFLHTPYSFHGVERIKQDTKEKRRTVYVDYYSESYQPYKEMSLDFDSTWFKHGTTFKLDSFFDYLKIKNSHYARSMLRYHFNRWVKKMGVS